MISKIISPAEIVVGGIPSFPLLHPTRKRRLVHAPLQVPTWVGVLVPVQHRPHEVLGSPQLVVGGIPVHFRDPRLLRLGEVLHAHTSRHDRWPKKLTNTLVIERYEVMNDFTL